MMPEQTAAAVCRRQLLVLVLHSLLEAGGCLLRPLGQLGVALGVQLQLLLLLLLSLLEA